MDKIVQSNIEFLKSKGLVIKQITDKQEIRSGKHELVGMFFMRNKAVR